MQTPRPEVPAWLWGAGPKSVPSGSLSTQRRLTLGADAPKIRDLHQHLGEHVGTTGPPFPDIDLQRLQQRLLQHVHLVWLLQVLAV